MSKRDISGSRRVAALAAATTLLGLAACQEEETGFLQPGEPVSEEAVLGFQLSSLDASVGDQISLGISVDGSSGASIGGVQGLLRWDPTQLRFLGQLPEEGTMVVINDARAEAGDVRLASLNAHGFNGRAAAFAFEVVGLGYASSLSFEPEVVGRLDQTEIRSRVEPEVALVANLPSPDGARRMDWIDWALHIDPLLEETVERDGQGGLRPLLAGLPPFGTVYGDATLDGNLNVLDAGQILNAAAGNLELVIGTEADPTNNGNPVDRITAANVRPDNGNTCPPGYDACGSEQRTINVLDGLAVMREAAFFEETVVGDPIPLPGPASDTVEVPADTLLGTRTFSSDTLYILRGILTVGDDEAGAPGAGELVIEPGTRVEGDESAAIFVTRNGRIIADGTPTEPITFSCELPSSGTREPGCWGGIFVAGNAVINEADPGLPPAPGIPGRNPGGGGNQRVGEGEAANFGGSNDADSSGVIRYVVVQYGGEPVATDNELNNLTIAACGSGTVLEHIQVHAGIDDGLEIFGGRCDVKHLYATANDDDQFDYSFGYDGRAQFVTIQMDPSSGDKGHEVDNTETPGNFNAMPRTNAQVWNITFVGGTAGSRALTAFNYRRGAGSALRNVLVIQAQTGFDVDDNASCNLLGTDLSLDYAVFLGVNNRAASDNCLPAVNAHLNDGNVAVRNYNGELKDPFNKILPDFRPVGSGVTAAFSPATPPSDGFFDTSAQYFGAVAPAGFTGGSVPWYTSWTQPWQSPSMR